MEYLSTPKNTLSKKLNANTLKLWQRLIATEVALEYHKRSKELKEARVEKFSFLEQEYASRAAVVLRKYKDYLPRGIDIELLCRDGLTSSKNLTGRQIWETIWETCSNKIRNILLPEWLRLLPTGSSTSRRNYDNILLELRIFMWDHEHNKPPQAPKKAATTVDDAAASASSESVEDASSSAKSKRAFDSSWFPLEWVAFLLYGPISLHPFPSWTTEKISDDQGIPKSPGGAEAGGSVSGYKRRLETSNKLQRKKGASSSGGADPSVLVDDDDEYDDESGVAPTGSKANLKREADIKLYSLNIKRIELLMSFHKSNPEKLAVLAEQLEAILPPK